VLSMSRVTHLRHTVHVMLLMSFLNELVG